MENQDNDDQNMANRIQDHAFAHMVNDNTEDSEIQHEIVDEVQDEESDSIAMAELRAKFLAEKKEQASNDMLYGALWCTGGVIATAADIGYIFWGAIVYGGIRFFKGLAKSSK